MHAYTPLYKQLFEEYSLLVVVGLMVGLVVVVEAAVEVVV